MRESVNPDPNSPESAEVRPHPAYAWADLTTVGRHRSASGERLGRGDGARMCGHDVGTFSGAEPGKQYSRFRPHG
ncbi:MAG: hypothetical protein ACLFVO_18115 [Chloroflexaceae bacterium]